MQSIKERQLSESTRTQLSDLADRLYDARGQSQDEQPQGDVSYVLFIGGEASTIQGRPFIDELQYQALVARVAPRFTIEQINEMSPDERLKHFSDKWLFPPNNVLRTRVLRETLSRLVFTQGHMSLAWLLKERYFPLVLTTTIDQMIETAFISSIVSEGKPVPQWSVLVNGHNSPEDIQRMLHSNSGTSILKLCGNAQSPAVTTTEIDEKILAIEQTVEEALQRDLILIGPTPLDELLLLHFPSLRNGMMSIHYISSREPPQALKRLLQPRDPVYIGKNEAINFDIAFQTLCDQIMLYSGVERATGRPPLEEEKEHLRKAFQENQTEQQAVSAVISSRVTTPSAAVAQDTERAADQAPVETMREQTAPAARVAQVDDDEGLIELLPAEEESLAALIDTTVLTVKLGADRKASFTVVGGAFNYTSSLDSRELDINVSDLNVLMQDMGRNNAMYHRLPTNNAERESGLDSWRRQAKREGKGLYANLVQAYPDLSNMLKVAQLAAEKYGSENLTLVFDGPREFLGMPYELLYGDDWLALSNPLCRRVSGLNPRHVQHFDAFIHALRRSKRPLKALFISAGTPGISPDKEIDDLQIRIAEHVRRLGLKFEPKVLSNARVMYDEVRKQLAKCQYHIVHYAGHGVFKATSEDSGLLLRRTENSDERVTLTARDLSGLLAASETRLVFLSTCAGAETGGDQLLRDFDYLGVMDAVVRSGVPYVLGFRWKVTDSGSRRFAAYFYDHLFEQPLVPERAAWHARRQIYSEKGNEETWISPILVAQNPYR